MNCKMVAILTPKKEENSAHSLLRLEIIDTLQNWANQKERESIKRKDFNDIASILATVFKPSVTEESQEVRSLNQQLTEKDKELSVKTNIIDHWRNEAGAFDLVCQKQSKEIASIKEEIENLKAVLQGETQLLRSAEEYAAGRNVENERLK